MVCPVIEVSSFKGTQWSRCLPPSPEDGKRFGFRIVCFLVRLPDNGRRQKKSAILSVLHHPQILYNSEVENFVQHVFVEWFLIIHWNKHTPICYYCPNTQRIYMIYCQVLNCYNQFYSAII
jgi:hypothetical protein